MTGATAPPISPTTAASQAFVARHLAGAVALGECLAPLAGRPDDFVAAIEAGFREMADPVYSEGVHRVTPGLGEIAGIRLGLMGAAHKAFKRGTRATPADALLDLVDRLIGNRYVDVRWFGMWNLERLLPADPERTWQLLRRAASEAREWITVDTLAHPCGAGVLREPRRWADLESLSHSPSRWERRLVGSTLATMPHARSLGGRDEVVVRRGLALVEQLIGDAEPDVQKALSWALRTFAQLAPEMTAAFLKAESQAARRDRDGNRAWVIRDSLSKLPADAAADLRSTLEGVRRISGGPSTARAAIMATELASSEVARRRPVESHLEG